MEESSSESKADLYRIYYTPEGKRLIVLEGLDPRDQVSSPPLQQFIHEHYPLFFYGYSILFLCTVLYLVGLYIAIPLLKKYRLY